MIAAAGPLQASDRSHDIVAQQQFGSGGKVEVELTSGAYVIAGTDSDSIAVTYGCDSPRALRQVKVNINTTGSTARITVADTPQSNFHAVIELPRRSALWVRLTAGDLRIEGLQGDKDIEGNAGNIEVEVPHPDEYGHRDASVLAGDLDASVFNISTGGLLRSFRQNGPGKYRLHAHLMAGNISYIEGN
ncbi:MAG TPA: hypothetical protein VGR50_02320 [Terriglobales bacterium]|nr:hypothetical protein [Terriglobales bacterium]